jgi:hypothetical protein
VVIKRKQDDEGGVVVKGKEKRRKTGRERDMEIIVIDD